MWTILTHTRLQADRCRARVAGLKFDDSGSAAIETALAYTMMMTCILGIIGFAMMAYTYSVYQDAARNGVRYAVVHGSDSSNCSGPTSGCGDPTGGHVVDAVTSYARPYAASISGMNIQVSYPDTGGCTPPSRVIVTVTYTYTPLFKVLPSGLVFQVSSQGRIVY
jgi:Flp pilus assembly protein TadG